MKKVKNFAGFMKSMRDNENEVESYGNFMGANPEEEMEEMEPMEGEENMEGEEDMEDEPVTLEDIKSMVDDLTARINILEGGEEDMEGEEEMEDEESEEEETEEEEEEEA